MRRKTSSGRFWARLSSLTCLTASSESWIAMVFLSRLLSLHRKQFRNVPTHQLGEAHRVEQLADGRLDLLDGPAEGAARHLGAVALVVVAAHDGDRPLERPHHLPDRDLLRLVREPVAALRAVLAHDQAPLRQTLEDLGEELGRDVELLRDLLDRDRTQALVEGDVLDRHQSIIHALRKAEHRLLVSRPKAYTFSDPLATVLVASYKIDKSICYERGSEAIRALKRRRPPRARRSVGSILNPAASTRRSVSRLGWQPPMM